MSRVAFSYNDWTENFPGGPVGNPSKVYRSNSAPGPYFNPQVDGGQVSLQGGGSGKAQIYSSSKWTFSANALYQLGWGIDLSGAVFGRQGSLFPVYMNLPAGRDGTLSVMGVPTVDTQRLDDVWNVDMRLAKSIKLGGSTLVLSAEGFNLLNNDLVLAPHASARTRRPSAGWTRS